MENAACFTHQDKVLSLQNMLMLQFNQRVLIEHRRLTGEFNISMNIETHDKTMWIVFSNGEEVHSVTIPLPYVEDGVILVDANEVQRALYGYFIEKQQAVITYLDVIHRILCDNPEGLIPDSLIRNIPFVQQMAYGFKNNNAYVTAYNTQRAINSVVNNLPLHKTTMNSLIINKRLAIIDRNFTEITDPEARLQYQVEKAKKYFENGWTVLGLSDGTLADKNYILTCDIRRLTPFGLKYHNPQRNLYSSLKMQGDELPLVRTETAQMLMDSGITRKGWNLFTVFADIPDVWEDQLMVDNSLADLSITYKKRIQCFGDVHVKEGESLKVGKLLSTSKDGIPTFFKTKCDKAFVKRLVKTKANVGGRQVDSVFLIIEFKRKLKEGVKITNTAANKGVIRLADLGYAIDPRDGSERKIQVIVSCKAVEKRKNYTQMLEALLNNVNDEQEIVLSDDAEPSIADIKDNLKAKGFPEDGTWMCYTYAGEFPAVCGKVFWGVTMDVEDALWEENDTIRTNERNLRIAGLKFSSIEFRSLNTRFGKDNPISKEIMSYAQGTSDLHDYIKILKSKRNESPEGVHHVSFDTLKPIDQSSGTIIPERLIKGSIADPELYPYGFMMKLPLPYQVLIGWDNNTEYEGIPQPVTDKLKAEYKCGFCFDEIYVPGGNLRGSWRHDTGNYGLTELSSLLNNILLCCYNIVENDGDYSVHVSMFYKAIRSYFHRAAAKLGSKRGEISTHGMSVRYPFSAKAVATLSNALPKNVIEIHRNMAMSIDVKDGDVVLVERFPCLGFMSIRPQKVKVTDDPSCKYTIRASKNSLGSLSLDFDGDVIYIASFHTPAAKMLLRKEWSKPNKVCYDAIERFNMKAGEPHYKHADLDDYNLTAFPPLTNEKHALIVKTLTSIKANTGPVIALAYNLMRIVENSEYAYNREVNVGVEVFLDQVGNSVFQQKHDGIEAMHDVVRDAICTADVEKLVVNGFDRAISTIICDLVRRKAAEIGIHDLVGHHEGVKTKGGSNVINKIVKTQNRIYFVSRSLLDGQNVLDCLDCEAVDIPSETLKWVISGESEKIKTALDMKIDKKVIDTKLKDEGTKKMCAALFNIIEATTVHKNTKGV